MSDTPLLDSESPENLDEYQKFIKHDTWRNVIAVSKTKLLELFIKAAVVMEDIHRKQLVDLYERMEKLSLEKVSVSRTTHNQIASIVKRYLTPLQEGQPELHAKLLPALEEAAKIEQLCERIMETSQRQRAKGNVRFVKQLAGTKAR